MSENLKGFMIRKINRAKWEGSKSSNLPDDIKSDAITSCLRTTANVLSIWNYEKEIDFSKKNEIDELKKFAVCCMTSKDFNEARVQSIDLVFIKTDDLKEFPLNKNKGESLFENVEDFHFDISVDNFSKLGKFASIIANITHSEDEPNFFCIRVTKAEVRKIISEARSYT